MHGEVAIDLLIQYNLNTVMTHQQQIQNFGDPFLLVIHEGETAADVMDRVQKKLRVPDEDFSKVIHIYRFVLPPCIALVVG